jgi:hypothetical protein
MCPHDWFDGVVPFRRRPPASTAGKVKENP